MCLSPCPHSQTPAAVRSLQAASLQLSYSYRGPFVMFRRFHPLGHVLLGRESTDNLLRLRLLQWLHYSVEADCSVTACAVNTTSDSSVPASGNLIWQATARSSLHSRLPACLHACLAPLWRPEVCHPCALCLVITSGPVVHQGSLNIKPPLIELGSYGFP